ncbi:redoxin domain-containing protein [Paludisphaera mucosa]|uniref:Redoxin domain-containing protein n=1 Tax=Paludisphaera mucosa TaxID=3030827 RepID=A0ABT6F711_9BACT|nr:redoxin domain-containing protein [Paludisphaera mucosa]MDG3003376.1 redoxin domain-containing protein [Paludisphaera mucosa]
MNARSRRWRDRFMASAVLLLAATAAAAAGDDASTDVLARIGRLQGLDGASLDPTPPADGATVLVFYSTECPIANAINPALNRLYGEFGPPRVKWFAVCVDPDVSAADLAAHAKEFGLKATIAVDRKGRLARRLGAKITPETFVVDGGGRLRYHGRIDDQFAARGVRKAAPGEGELRPALAAVLAGGEVKAPFVEAVGCPLPEAAEAPTYSKDVAAILQNSCRECHRKGQLGPFALDTYEQARKRAGDLANVVEDRSMPPWKAAPGVGPKFQHDRSLSTADVETISAWAEAGAPEGDPKDLPAPRAFPEEWAMEGGPDLVLDIGGDFPIAASGDDVYRCFVLRTDLPEDVYVSGVEYKPGNARVVHHILGYVDVSGEARKRDEAEEGPGYTSFSGPGVEIIGDLGGWAPGAAPSILAEGVGRALPKKADVIVQIHYHPCGKPETDRSRLGLKFARKPVKQTLHWNGAFNYGLDLPPGESNIEVRAKWTVPVDAEARAVAPHMHLLGKDMHMFVTFPDGRTRDLIRIDGWDFNWQSQYYFDEPIDLPRGSVVQAVAHYDNSASNPHNPNAKDPQRVTWGEATTDEMCIGFIAVTKKGQDLTRPGEKDDLHDIFTKQREEAIAKIKAAREKAGR